MKKTCNKIIKQYKMLVKFNWGKLASPLLLLIAISAKANSLSIDEIAKHIENNLDVKLARLDTQLAKTEEIGSLGDFDIQLAISYFKSYENEAQTTVLENESVIQQTIGQSIGFNKKFSLGTEIDFTIQNMEKTSNSINRSFDKWYQTANLIKIKQPLLKGLGNNANLVKYKQSQFKIKRYEIKLQKTIQETKQQAYDLFWKISSKDKEIELRKQNIESYKKLNLYFLKAKKLGKQGIIKKIEVESILTNEQTLLMQVKNERKNLFLKLNKLLNTNYTHIEEGMIPEELLNYKESLATSLTANQVEKNLKLEEEKILLEKLSNSALPILDLEFEYLLPGIAEQNDNSWQQVNSTMFPNTKISLNFSWSFGNSYAEGRYAAQLAKIRSQKQRILKLSEQTKNNLKQEYTNISKLRAIYQEGIQQKDNYIKKLEIKKNMYESGIISLIELNKTIADNTNQVLSWHTQQIEYLKTLNMNYTNTSFKLK